MHLWVCECFCCTVVLYCSGDNLWCYWGCYAGSCFLSLFFWLSDTLILFPSCEFSSYSVLSFLQNNQAHGMLAIRFHLCLLNSPFSTLSFHCLKVFLCCYAHVSPYHSSEMNESNCGNNCCFVFLFSDCTFSILAVCLFYGETCVWQVPYLMFTCSVLINHS